MNVNLDKFKTFIQESGATMLLPTNPYEEIRFRSKDGIGIVYSNKKGNINLVGVANLAYEFFVRNKKWKAGRGYYCWERPQILDAIIARDGKNCFYCGKELGEDMTVEHLLAQTHGGGNSLSNLCLTHADCNQKAGSLSLTEKILLFFERKQCTESDKLEKQTV